MQEQIIFSWSGGKDSALALEQIKKNKNFSIATLLTTVNEVSGEVTLQRIPKTLIKKQAEALGYSVELVSIPENCLENEYKIRMQQILEKLADRNITATAFGDLYLDWIRNYREERLSLIDMKAIFPLWGKDTGKLAQNFIRKGYRAIVTSIDTQKMGPHFLGRKFDEKLIIDLPEGIDPCGENGEFHTFVYDGPIFNHPVSFKLNENLRHSGPFCFVNLEE